MIWLILGLLGVLVLLAPSNIIFVVLCILVHGFDERER